MSTKVIPFPVQPRILAAESMYDWVTRMHPEWSERQRRTRAAYLEELLSGARKEIAALRAKRGMRP